MSEQQSIVPPGFEEDVQHLIELAQQQEGDPTAITRRLQALEQILGRLPEGEHLEFRAALLSDLGSSYNRLPTGDQEANLRRAIECYEAALSFPQQAATFLDFAMMRSNLGGAYYRLPTGDREANLRRAIECCEGALLSASPVDAPLTFAMAQTNRGNAYADLPTGDREDNLMQAIACYEAALTVYTPQDAPYEYGNIQTNLGSAYAALPAGDREANLRQAIACYEKALKVLTSKSAPLDFARAQNTLGRAYYDFPGGNREANLKRAIACHEAALKCATAQTAPYEYATSQNHLGNAYRDLPGWNRGGNLKRAAACYEAALAVYTLSSYPADHRVTSRNLGHLHFSERRWPDALKAYRSAIAAGDSLLALSGTEAGRKAEVGETSGLFASAAYCLIQMRQPGEALLMHERGKTRLMAESLALGEADLRALPSDQREKMEQARRAVRSLEGRLRLLPDSPSKQEERMLADLLSQARADLRGLIEAIRTDQPDFMSTGLSLPEILALVPEGSALVAPVITSQGGAVFVVPHGVKAVTADHVIRLEKFTSAEVKALVTGSPESPGWAREYLSFRLGHRSGEDWQTAIDRLCGAVWDLMIAPVHERLRALKVRRLLLMPAGGLQLLPLHAAWREVNGSRRALLDDYEIAYTPSAYALSTAQKRSVGRTGKEALLAGIDVYVNYPPLISACSEVRHIAGVFEAQPLLDEAASKEAIRKAAQGKAYLHLSCHGEFDWAGNPLDSALVLAGDEKLTLGELMGGALDLSANRLVTLSACETGVTDVSQSPDESIGLPAGFMQAGAVAVVSSLWTVDDRSTALLMERFYKNHLEGGMSLPAALREAQLWLRDTHEKYSHPFYWAAFTYNGA